MSSAKPLSKNELLVVQASRSRRARSLDKRKTHKTVKHWSSVKAQKQWLKDPGRLDLVGIDTKGRGGFYGITTVAKDGFTREGKRAKVIEHQRKYKKAKLPKKLRLPKQVQKAVKKVKVTKPKTTKPKRKVKTYKTFQIGETVPRWKMVGGRKYWHSKSFSNLSDAYAWAKVIEGDGDKVIVIKLKKPLLLIEETGKKELIHAHVYGYRHSVKQELKKLEKETKKEVKKAEKEHKAYEAKIKKVKVTSKMKSQLWDAIDMLVKDRGEASYMDVYIQTGEMESFKFDAIIRDLLTNSYIYEPKIGTFKVIDDNNPFKKKPVVSKAKQEFKKLWKESKEWEKQRKKEKYGKLKRLKGIKTRMTGVERMNLERLVKKRATEQGFDPEAIDIKAYVDPNLTYSENKRLLEKHLPLKKPQDMSEKEIRSQIEKWEVERQDYEKLIEERDRAKRRTLQTIKELQRKWGGAKVIEIERKLIKEGITYGEVEEALNELKMDGEIYEFKFDQFKAV